MLTLLLALPLLLTTDTPQVSPADIELGGQMLRLGMPRSEVVAKLSACCSLTAGGDSSFVQSKTGPPFEMLGAIWFTDGRVSALRANRGRSDDAKTAAFILGLFRTLTTMAPRGSVAVIGTQTEELANGTSRSITIRLQDKRVLKISAGSPDAGGGFVEVFEER